MKESGDFIEMKIPAKPEFVGVIRLTVSGIASRMGFNYEDIEDIKVALSEAVTNAIHHAYHDEEMGEVVLGFGMYHNRLEVKVKDNGKSFDAKSVQEQSGPYTKSMQLNDLPEGGLGLFLIESLMDRLVINDEAGVTVEMTKLLERDGVEKGGNTISTSKSR